MVEHAETIALGEADLDRTFRGFGDPVGAGPAQRTTQPRGPLGEVLGQRQEIVGLRRGTVDRDPELAHLASHPLTMLRMLPSGSLNQAIVLSARARASTSPPTSQLSAVALFVPAYFER